MKLLVATGLYPPDIGGPATYATMLEAYLPERGIELLVAPYGWVRHYPKLFRHLVYTWKLIRLARGCNALYALDPVSVGFPTYLAHVVTRKPYMVRIAGDYAWEQGQRRFGVTEPLDEFVVSTKKHHLFVRVLRSLQTKVARSAQRVVVPSNYMKRIVASWGVDKEHITVIHSALHPLAVDKTHDEVRKMFDYKGTVLITAARLVPWKGIDVLIALMPKLKERIGDVMLVVVGEGLLRSELEEQAKALKLQSTVRFVGRLHKDALGTALKGADIFVLNSGYEGLSHQILEAMDLGLPVVTTDIGGNPELITDGVSGLLVPYGDKEALLGALTRMATHEEMRDQVIKHARLRVKDFSEEKGIDELVALLHDVFA
jgi:glycosyltransferase involved in cell wall biosynthesis